MKQKPAREELEEITKGGWHEDAVGVWGEFYLEDLIDWHKRQVREIESYTPEQIIQAYSIVLSKHGRIYVDELILELIRNFKAKLKGEEK